jgi:hypothetical protein
MIIFPTLFIQFFVEEPISQRLQLQNWGFILFLVCFFIFIQIINNTSKLLTTMLKGLWKNNNKESIFAEQIKNEFIIKSLLSLQTIVLCAVNLFSYLLFQKEYSHEIGSQMFPFIIKASMLIFAFLLYKSVTYNIIGTIFFQKGNLREWNDYFFSIICLSGFILFLPTLLLFYIEKTLYFCWFFYSIYFISIIILIFRKIYVLFFPRKTLLLYFILYLCAQEIIPLYFLYKGLEYLFIV